MSLHHNKEIRSQGINTGIQQEQSDSLEFELFGPDQINEQQDGQEIQKKPVEEQEPEAKVEDTEKKADEAIKSLPPSIEYTDLKTTIFKGKPVSPAERERLNREQAAWKAVRDFKTTIRLHEAGDLNEEDLADMTLSDMTAALVTDKESKSEVYADMQNALASLSMMASSDGKYVDKDGNPQNADFYSVLYKAREATDRYVDTHAKRRRFSTNGLLRLAMAKRIKALLALLDKDVEKARAEANISAKKEGVLSENAPEILTNDELRKIEDERGKEAANLAAVGSFIESHPELTLRVPRMKGELHEYLMEKISKDTDAMKRSVADFMPLLAQAAQSFAEENSQKLARAEERKQKIISRLDLTDETEAVFGMEVMAGVLFDMEDEAYQDELKKLFMQSVENDALIADIVTRRINNKYAQEVFLGAKKMLGSARIFAGALDLAILTNEYMDRLKYTNPDAFEKVRVDGWNIIESRENEDDSTRILEDFSFISRMKGDLLLKSNKVLSVFKPEEIAVLSRNMTTVLMCALHTNDLDAYNAMTFREFRMAASCITDRLVKNAPRYRALAESGSESVEVMQGMLLRLAEASTTDDTFDAVLAEERQKVANAQQRTRNRYLVDIATGTLKADEMNAVPEKELQEAARVGVIYTARMDQLKKFADGRFAPLAEYLAKLPEIFDLLTAADGAGLQAYMSETLPARFGALAEGLAQAKEIAPAAKQLYLDANFDRIEKGSIEGDAAFFKERMTEYNDKLYNEKYDGEHSISGNIDQVVAELQKEIPKQYPARDASFKDSALVAVFAKIESLNADKEQFALLKEPKQLKKLLAETVAAYDKAYDNPENTIQIPGAPVLVFKPDAAYEALAEQIEAEKEKGKGRRDKYLRLNNEKVEQMRKGKSVVMADHRSGDLIRLEKSEIDERRGRIDRILGYLNLHETLKSILLERISAGGGLSAVLSDETLLKAGRKMDEFYRVLPKMTEGKEAMGEEEVLMLMANLFSNPNTAAIFYQPDIDITPAQLLERKEVKAFRENYRKLIEFEKIEVTDATLAQEQRDMSRNLRMVLMTGAGLYDEKGRAVQGKRKEDADHEKLFGDTAVRHINYVTYQNKFLTLLRDCLDTHEDYRNRSELYKERSVFGFRTYFQNRIMNDLKEKKEFSEEAYKAAIMEVLSDATKAKLVTEEPASVNSETHPWMYDKAFDATYTQEDVDKLINENTWPLFKGCVTKYRELDTDQKKLFCVCLSLLDTGALGMDTGGTNALLLSENLRKRQENTLEDQIAAYVAGGELHITVDYKEAMHKLVSRGINRFKMDWTTLSEEAFNEAHKFAVQIKQKRIENGERDFERISDGISSIRAAAALGVSKQYNEAEKMTGLKLTVEDVFNRLLMYAKTDGNAEMEAALSHIAPGHRPRFARMLVRVLQDRTVFDTTTLKDSVAKVDAAQRDALFDALSADRESREDAMRGFDDAASCEQALITALSFQLRDDENFKNKTIKAEHFRDGALERESLVDWGLIKKAMTFISEVTQRNIAVGAVKDAPKYIAYSGNEKAIAAHGKLKETFKEPKEAKQGDLELFLRHEAESSGDEAGDAKLLLGGYFALTKEQKDLFVKVLGRRDLLDISKKNLYKNLVTNAERDYVNGAGRSALTDEYIAKNIGGGSGITLDENAHFAAMETLLSTQIDDTAAFATARDVSKVIATERCFLMGRKTAVDWKLFKRALNFVHRASEELAMREGNAELYRAAGDLQANGSLTMDYKFLRKNFHNTGSRYFRFAAKNAVAHADKKWSATQYVDYLVKGSCAVFGKSGVASYVMSDNTRVRIKESIASGQKQVSSGAKMKVNKPAVVRAKLQLKDPKLFYDMAKRNVDAIMASEDSIEKAVDKLTGVFKKYVTDTTGVGQMFYSEKAGKVKASGSKSMTKEMIAGVKKNYHEYTGDIRDDWWYVSAGYTYGKMALTNMPGGPALADYIKSKLISKAITSLAGGDKANLDLLKKKESISRISDDVQKALVKIVGEKNAAEFIETTNIVNDIARSVDDRLKSIIKLTAFATKAVDTLSSICDRANNIMMVEDAKEKAAEKYKDADEKKLKEGEKFQDERQKKLAKDAAEHNADYTAMAAKTTEILQGYGIAADTINLAVEAIADFTKGMPSEMLAQSVSMGAEFVVYALRCMSDKSVLKDYYQNTAQGRQVVADIKSGVKTAYPTELTMHEELEKRDVLDLVMMGKGFEKMEELVAHTGMSIAQTVVFAASSYNPMMQTKVVAMTVMSVLGCADLIGTTTAAAVEKVYSKMAAG